MSSRCPYLIHHLFAVVVNAVAVAQHLRASDRRKEYHLVGANGQTWMRLSYRAMAEEVVLRDAKVQNVGPLMVKPYIVTSEIGDRAAIPDWQPRLDFGFQGRQVLLFAQLEYAENGRPSGERVYKVIAMGNDGEVRRCLTRYFEKIQNGLVGVVHLNNPAPARRLMAMIDIALAYAMPASFLRGIEAVTTFTVTVPDVLTDERRARLLQYEEALVAPKMSHKKGVTGEWDVHWSNLPDESLYALCEVYGGTSNRIVGASHGLEKADAGAFLSAQYRAWLNEYHRAA